MGAYDDLIPQTPGPARKRGGAYDDLLPGGAPAPAPETAEVVDSAPAEAPTPGLFQRARDFVARWNPIGAAVRLAEATQPPRDGPAGVFDDPRYYVPPEERPQARPAPPEIRRPEGFTPIGGGSRLDALRAIPRLAGDAVVEQVSGLGRIAGDVGSDLGVPGAERLGNRSTELARRAAASQQLQQAPFMPVGPSGFGPRSIEDVPGDIAEWFTEPGNIAAVGRQAPQLAGVAAALMGVNPGAALLTTIGLPITGQSYHDYREKGYDAPLALLGAMGQAGAEMVPELAWAKFARTTPITSLAGFTKMSQPERAAVIGGFLKGVGKLGVTELAEEEVSTLSGWLVDYMMRNPEATIEKLGKDMLETVRQTALFAPVMTGAALAGRELQRRGMETPSGRASVLADELRRAVEETELSGPIAETRPIVPRETPAMEPLPAAPRQKQGITGAAREAYEELERRAAAQKDVDERRLSQRGHDVLAAEEIERAEQMGGGLEEGTTALADAMERALRERQTADLGESFGRVPAVERTDQTIEEDEAPLGVGVRGAAAESLRPDLTGGVSPISSTVSPEAARERLGRSISREDDVGAPLNKRTVLRDKDGEFVVGRVTPEDWRQRVKKTLTFDELHRSRNWYRKLHDTLTPIYGEEAPAIALGWLLSQKNASPSQGFMNVLRARDKVKGRPGDKIAGLNEKAIMDVLQGKTPEGGIGAKLHDFLDSELGLPTRTVMGRDPRGGQPAAIDIWALRDHGRVDEATMNYIRKRFGDKTADRLAQDSEGAGEAQYEYGSRFYNDIVKELNKRRFAGGGWTAREVQAVGWVAMQKQLGTNAEFVEDIVSKNTRRVSVGLEPGHGSGGRTFTPKEADKLIRELAEMVGANILRMEHGEGAYLNTLEGSVQIDALATPEVVADFLSAIGYAMRQSSVIGTRALKTGRQDALQIVAPELLDPAKAKAFWTALQSIEGMADLIPGYQQNQTEGKEGLRLLNFGGHWSQRQLARIEEAINTAAESLDGGVTDVIHFPVELVERGNDWQKQPDGKAYLDSLSKRGRDALVRQLVSRYGNQGDAGTEAGTEEAPLAVGVRRGKRGSIYDIEWPRAPKERLDAFLTELDEGTTAHPFDDRQRLRGTVGIEASPWEGMIHLSSLISYGPKNRGDASKVLKELIEMADQHQVALHGTAKAIENAGGKGKSLSTKQLTDWYERHGFEIFAGDVILYRPKPVGVGVQHRGREVRMAYRLPNGDVEVGGPKDYMHAQLADRIGRKLAARSEAGFIIDGKFHTRDEAERKIGTGKSEELDSTEISDEESNLLDTAARKRGFKSAGDMHTKDRPAFDKMYEGLLRGEGVRASEAEITSDIDRDAAPEEKVKQLTDMTAANEPVVREFISTLDRELGTRSKSNRKAPDKILEKSRRPSIKAEKPWFDVEHVRDSFRFKSVIDNITSLQDIAKKIREAGWQVVKVDTPKVLQPAEWGWRIVSVDLKMPNGQIVEYYMPVAELEQAKRRVNHELFERWRNEDLSKLGAEQIKAFERDIIASRRLYNAAWKAYLRRVGQSVEDVKAALSSFERVLGSGAPISSTSESVKAMPSTQRPPTSERATPSRSTRARDPSGDESTVTGESVAGEGSRRGIDMPRKTMRAQPSEVGMRMGEAPSVLRKFVQDLDANQAEIVAGALVDLRDRGMPDYLIQSVRGWWQYPTNASDNDAMFYPVYAAVGVRFDRLNAASTKSNTWAHEMPNILAHELHHQLDSKGQEEQETFTFHAFSHDSPRLAFDIKQEEEVDDDTGKRGWWVEPKGDLFEEAYNAYAMPYETPDALVGYLSYPLSGMSQFKEETIKSELFAQIGALYFTNPGTVKKHLPKWYDLMESIHGAEDQPKSLSDARERLQQALQGEGSGERAQGRRVRSEDRPSASRRDPGEGVGVGARAGPGSAGGAAQPPAANRRGAPASPVSWNVEQPLLRDALVRAFQNNQIDLKRVEEAIERAGGVIREAGRPYLTEELYHGRVSARIHKFEREKVRPLLSAIKEAGLTPDQFGDFLWARHAPERNAQMLKVNPTLGTDGAGMSDATARQKMADIRRSAKSAQALDRAVSMVDAITKETRRILVDEHLEEQQTIDNWDRVYKHYVPLHRDTDAPREGKGFKVQGPESKRAMGSGRPAVAVLAAVIAQHEAAVTRAEKARVGRDLVKLAEEFPNESFWRVDQPPTKQTINPTTGLVQSGIDPLYKFREDVFVVKDADPNNNGRVRERVVSFNPDNERALRVARAMQRLDVAEFGAATKIVGKVSRYLANLATQWNPAFWATNFLRDVQTASINLQSTKLRGKAPRVLSRIPAAMAGISRAEFRDNNTSTWARHYREFQEDGGQTGWRHLWEDMIDRQRELEKMVDRSGKPIVSPSVMGHWLAEQISRLNTTIENATRLSAYVVARESGISRREAASIAKNMTVNFNRKGNRGSVTAAWYMFFNANVQGTARMLQALATSRKAQAMVGAMVAFGAALELLNRLIGEDDKDEAGNNPYELVDEHVKQRNWVIMVPGRDEKGRARRVTIPMPYGFNVFPSFGRLVMEGVLGAGQSKLVTEKRSIPDLAWSMVETMADAFIPLGQSTTPLQFASPTVADPIVQVLENKTWYGAPLVPKRERNNQQVPRSELYFASNSETAKDLAQMMNVATGGNALEPGALDIHPGHIDHVFKTLTGGPGTFGVGMFDWGRNIAERAAGKEGVEPLPAKRIPFVGKFYGEIDERELESKFYRLKEQADVVYGRYRALKKAGEHDRADELEGKEPALIAFAREAARSTFVKEGRELRQEMKGTRDLPKADRQQVKENIKREQSQLYQRALEAYNAAAQEGGR